MSQVTQLEFARLVNEYYQRHRNVLALGSPDIKNNGFISKATMLGSGGSVEILCGPAEYHAEIFINTIKDKKHWNLADLMNTESVREWLVNYSKSANTSGKSVLESDIEWVFLILIDGLKDVADFEWLQKR